MSRYRIAASITALAGALGLVACGSAPRADAGTDAAFGALQARGEVGMGVDQHVSTHVFDALPDGGRIEYQHDSGDPEGVALIRDHLREIQAAFEAGDFSTPAFVHDRKVPGTDVMAARREHIEYRYEDLPRGGELRLVTSDPEALEAIRAFMAFQRDDHRAEGMDHGDMDHGDMDHDTMDHGTMHPGDMDHGDMDHDTVDHGTMDPGGMDHGDMGPGAADPDTVVRGMGRGGMNHGGMRRGGMGQGMSGARMGRGPMGGEMGRGGMGGGMGPGGMAGHDPAFAADMQVVHELVTNNRAITRTVEHLPNGIRTLTESSSPAIAGYINAHVASMEKRLDEGEVFNLFSHTLPVIFEGWDRIESTFEYTETGVAVVQTSDDPALVEALQAHAAEVTELVDEGMIAMMRGMMEGRMQGMMRGMHEGGPAGERPAP